MDKKTVTKELTMGDAIIQRADNGWVLTTIESLYDASSDEMAERTAVFEDPDIHYSHRMHDNPMAHSLSKLLRTAFDEHMQSKHNAGMAIATKQSRACEEMKEEAMQAQVTGNVGEGYNNINIKNEMEHL